MRLTIVKDDDLVIVDQHPIRFDLTPFLLPENLHALQWYEDHGEEEFNDGTPNNPINDISPYQPIIDEHSRLKIIEDNPPPPDEYQKYSELVSQRDGYLAQTDWLVTRHRDQMLATDITISSLDEEQHQQLQTWRQELRELDDNYPTSDVWIWPDAPEFMDKYLEQYPPEGN